jgi:hypothetical protein
MGSDSVIDLSPSTDSTGQVIWTVPASGTSAEIEEWGERADVSLSSGSGEIFHVDDQGVSRQLSRLPTERMAGVPDAWSDIVRNLNNAEEGRRHDEVTMLPGGTLEVTKPGQASRPLSRLPQERMAGFNPGPSAADVNDVMAIDPDRVEHWTPQQTGLLNGWKFRLRPERGAPEYVFLAFRSPADGNLFRIFVVKPDVDSLYGHRPHMIKTVVGGQEIPVICGPDGRAARTLAEARTFAGKWMIYNYRLNTPGMVPGFSA